MHYNLGRKMYEVYWDRLFGGSQFEPAYHQSKFYVESTATNRTIETAQSHLYGILERTEPLRLNYSQLPNSRPPSYPGIHATAGNQKFSSGPLYGKGGEHYHPIPIHVYGKNMSVF
jgi:hypothetical protein